MLVYSEMIKTPLGTLRAVVDAQGVHELTFIDQIEDRAENSASQCLSQVTVQALVEQLKRELAAYFQGRLKHFSVPVIPAGTDFQKRSWAVLRTIPYGKTLSYAEEAEALKMPQAYRAAANANAANPIAILIPCHRVINKNGKLGGYAGGVWRKEKLLAIEQLL